MSRVCKICGTKLNDDDNYCVICDKYVDAIDETERGIDKDDKSAFAVYNKSVNVMVEKKSNAKVIVFAVIGVLIVLATVLYFVTYPSRSYGKIVEKYYHSMFEGIEKDYKESLLDEYLSSNKDKAEIRFLAYSTLNVEGCDFKYEIDKATKLSKDEKEELVRDIKDCTGADVDVSQAFKVNVTIEVKNGIDTTTGNETVWVVKISGKNYIFPNQE